MDLMDELGVGEESVAGGEDVEVAIGLAKEAVAVELEEKGAGGVENLSASHVPGLHEVIAEIIEVAGLGEETGADAGAGGGIVTGLEILRGGGEVGVNDDLGSVEIDEGDKASDAAAGAVGVALEMDGMDLIGARAIGAGEKGVKAPEEELDITEEGVLAGEEGVLDEGELEAVTLGEVDDVDADVALGAAEEGPEAGPEGRGAADGE